mgnify:FL=1
MAKKKAKESDAGEQDRNVSLSSREQLTEEIAKVEDLQDEQALIEKPKEGLAVELGEVKEL